MLIKSEKKKGEAGHIQSNHQFREKDIQNVLEVFLLLKKWRDELKEKESLDGKGADESAPD